MEFNEFNVGTEQNEHEKLAHQELARGLRSSPIPDDELDSNLGLYMPRQTLSRILFMKEMYSNILDVHGVVMEFGVRWGQNLALFSSLRGIFEPFNHNRLIVGFDTFTGFPSVDEKDGTCFKPGDYSVTENYEVELDRILSAHGRLSPIPHMKKHRLVKGDAVRTINTYIEENPETVVALAYFDFDLYAPTKACIEAILPRVAKGGVLGFDQLNCPSFPGETLAVMETIGLGRYRLHRSPLSPLCSYVIVE